MPLQPNTAYVLNGQSRPGDAMATKPKKAFLVKLSQETLASLESLPNPPAMELDFGASRPGLYIGDDFFPIKQQPEDKLHELYIRASSASKPNGPLKLHATISGRLLVQRDIEDISQKLRRNRDAAQKERSKHNIVVLDPGDLPVTANPTKRKRDPVSIMLPRPPRKNDRQQPIASTSSTATQAESPRHPQKDLSQSSALRARLIRYLAMGDRMADDSIKAVAPNCDSVQRQQVLKILEDIANPMTNNDADRLKSPWRLKPKALIEVRPNDPNWSLSESDRMRIIRSCRQAARTEKLDKDDPIWAHFATNVVSSSAPSQRPPSTSTPDPPKRGVSAKEKKKPKADPKAEVQMKDESKYSSTSKVSRTSVASAAPPKLTAESATAAAASAVARRPGSGYQRRPSSQDIRSPSADLNPSSTFTKVSDTLERRTEKPLAPQPAMKPPRIKKIKTEDGVLDREISRSASNKPKEALPSMAKRKKLTDMDDDSDNILGSSGGAAKRRKTETPPMVGSSTGRREHLLPKKPEGDMPPRQRVPKTESAASQQRVRHSLPAHTRTPSLTAASPPPQSHTSSSSTTKKSSASGKRAMPVYTDSEDDDPDGGSVKASKRVVPLVATRTTTAPSSGPDYPRTSSASSSSSDRTSLRAQYQTSYTEYIGVFNKLYQQKTLIDRMLEKSGSDSLTDSEGDVDMMDSEALLHLAASHKKQRDDLQSIRQVFV